MGPKLYLSQTSKIWSKKIKVTSFVKIHDVLFHNKVINNNFHVTMINNKERNKNDLRDKGSGST